MGPIGIGRDAGFANRLSDLEACFVDEWMMDLAMRRMDDAMTAGLKEPDLGVLGLSAHGESRAMAMTTTRGRMDGGLRQSGDRRQLVKTRPYGLGQMGGAKSWAARAGRSMRALFWLRHPSSLALSQEVLGALLSSLDARLAKAKKNDCCCGRTPQPCRSIWNIGSCFA